MKKIIYAAFLVLLIIPGFAQKLQEGKVVVLISESYAKNTFFTEKKNNGRSEFKFEHEAGQRLFNKFQITKIERTYPEVRDQDNDERSKILKRYYTITGNFRRDRMMMNIINEGNDFFEDVEPVSIAAEVKAVPNDYFTFTTNDPLELINARFAWTVTEGSSSVNVAVSDPTGFWFSHPDWVNSNSTNQLAYRHSSAIDESYNPPGPNTNPNQHGLWVASVAAAASNNSLGIAGMGYKTKFMAFGADYNNMLVAARDHGAKIITASWSSSCTYSSPSQQLVIDQIHDYGAMIVASAGNGNQDQGCQSPDGQWNGIIYPAGYNKVLAVGSVNSTNHYFNSITHHTFNSSVDVTAPGYGVRVMSVYFTTNPNGTISFGSWDYGTLSGTSLATPVVSGIAALCLAIEPNLTNNQLERIIKGSVINVNGVSGNSVYAGVSGTGRVDAYQAVQNTRDCFACTDVLTLPMWVDDDFIGDYYGIPPGVNGCKVEVGSYTTAVSENLELSATKMVKLLPGFRAVAGSTVTVKIDARCVNYLTPNSPNGARTSSDAVTPQITYRDLLESGQVEISEEEFFNEASFRANHFPNPATDNFLIDYFLPDATQVEIRLTNLDGKLVNTLVDEYQEAGSHNVKVNTASLARGVYLYTVKTNSHSQTRKVVLVE